MLFDANSPFLETMWRRQLVSEHQYICWSRGVSLHEPDMVISNDPVRLGQWFPEQRVMAISRHLITRHPWEFVREVLKHEMAHQYVWVYCGAADIHGKFFREACRKLGVHPAFISSTLNYPQMVESFHKGLPEEAKKLLDRVEKLTALGTSSNEFEAREATRKANYLIHKYNLEKLTGASGEPDTIYLTISHRKKRIDRFQSDILTLLESYYYVTGIYTYTFDAMTAETYRAIVIVGRQESIRVAEHVYHFLMHTGQTLWQTYRQNTRAGLKARGSFLGGFMEGVIRNHKEMLASADTKLTGSDTLTSIPLKELMVLSQTENQTEVHRLFPKLGTVSDSSGTYVPEAYESGLEQGKNTHVRKAIRRTGDGRIPLLDS